MFYLDSAVLVSLHCEEQTTEAVRRWITRRTGPWYISEWVLTECVSAFGLKVRRKELSVEQATMAVDAIDQLSADSLNIIPITQSHHQEARFWLRNFTRPFRAADALHMAIARQSGCSLATYDAELLAAAKALKVKAVKTLV